MGSSLKTPICSCLAANGQVLQFFLSHIPRADGKVFWVGYIGHIQT